MKNSENKKVFNLMGEREQTKRERERERKMQEIGKGNEKVGLWCCGMQGWRRQAS